MLYESERFESFAAASTAGGGGNRPATSGSAVDVDLLAGAPARVRPWAAVWCGTPPPTTTPASPSRCSNARRERSNAPTPCLCSTRGARSSWADGSTATNWGGGATGTRPNAAQALHRSRPADRVRPPRTTADDRGRPRPGPDCSPQREPSVRSSSRSVGSGGVGVSAEIFWYVSSSNSMSVLVRDDSN